jgi:hypothetical protein
MCQKIMTIWSSLRSTGIFYGHLVYFVAIWYIMALWYILVYFGIFCGHLLYFVVIWSILLPMGIYGHLVYIFCGHLVYFWYSLWLFGILWYVVPRKTWQHRVAAEA